MARGRRRRQRQQQQQRGTETWGERERERHTEIDFIVVNQWTHTERAVVEMSKKRENSN